MMALGIVFHGAATYTTFPVGPVWRFKDRAVTPVCDVLFFLTHAFRMPLFFVLAGFFANLLFERVGTAAFFRHRAKRILVPFVVGWLLLYLPTASGMVYGAAIYTPSPWLAVRTYFRSGAFLHHLTTMHLWFLYYLLYFYAAILLLRWTSRALLGTSAREAVGCWFRSLVRSPFRAVIFAVPTACVLAFMRTGGFDTDTGFVLRPTVVAAYAIFFGFGWLLWQAKDLLPRFQRHADIHVLLALLIAPLNIFFGSRNFRSLPRYDGEAHAIVALTTSLICWLLIFGLMGLAQRYMNRNSGRVRYLADASYWMYLVHLPIVLWLQIALAGWNAPASLKFLIVVMGTTAITLVTYELFVRYTYIGSVLNGFRPKRKDSPAPALGAATA
jgi:glucan biosynthesis protein C